MLVLLSNQCCVID